MSLLSASQLQELKATVTEGNRLATAIALAAVTQLDIQGATGLPQSYISDVARNRYRTITVENARKFAEFFGCSIEDLFPSREVVA